MKFLGFISEEDASTTTAAIETIACIGIVASSTDMKSIGIIAGVTPRDIKNDPVTYEGFAIKALKHAKSIVERSSYDWNTTGQKYVLGIEESDLGKIVRMCKIIKGMHDFVNEVVMPVIQYPTFIHNSIGKYRKVEQDSLGKIEGEKANVTDFIITNAKTPEQLFDSIEENGVTSYPEESKGYVVTGSYTYFQISFKESDKSQVGKATIPGKNLGLVPPDTAAEMDPVFKKISRKLQEQEQVSEGLISTLKNAWTWLISKIKPSVKKLQIETKAALCPTPDRQDYLKVLSFYKNDNIEEAKDTDIFISQSKKKITDPFARQAIISISNNPQNMINEINRKLEVAATKATYNKIPIIVNKLPSIRKLSGPSEEVIQTCYALVCNYISAEFLINFVSRADDMSNIIKKLLAGMYFGNTKLPVWKVYGYGKKHEYLGTYDVFVQNLPDFTIDPFGARAYPNTRKLYGYNEYYVFNILIINNVTEKEKEYVVLRSGNYSSSHISYCIEGTITVSFPLIEKMTEMLMKVKVK